MVRKEIWPQSYHHDLRPRVGLAKGLFFDSTGSSGCLLDSFFSALTMSQSAWKSSAYSSQLNQLDKYSSRLSPTPTSCFSLQSILSTRCSSFLGGSSSLATASILGGSLPFLSTTRLPDVLESVSSLFSSTFLPNITLFFAFYVAAVDEPHDIAVLNLVQPQILLLFFENYFLLFDFQLQLLLFFFHLPNLFVAFFFNLLSLSLEFLNALL